VVEPAGVPGGDVKPLEPENQLLRQRYEHAATYIREKVDELLKVIGTSPLRPEELDDETLIASTRSASSPARSVRSSPT